MSGYPNKPHILLTNDDGLGKSEGLKSLYLSLSKRFTVTVVAPFYEQSGKSQSITILSPIFIDKINNDKKGVDYIYAVKGTPTDCVKIAFSYILKRLPDFVVSGINLGANVGLDVFYSGTVAAAIESSFWGVTSFAVSVEKHTHQKKKLDLRKISQIAGKVIRSLIKTNPPRGSIFNINIPSNTSSIKGIKYTRQDLRLIKDNFIKGIDPRGRHYYWMTSGHRTISPTDSPDDKFLSDIMTLKSGYISITPLKANFTNDTFLTNHPQINPGLFIR
ncbi:MAG: 5'/3'-nucleotidase SurE [Planctomycetota bacterium]